MVGMNNTRAAKMNRNRETMIKDTRHMAAWILETADALGEDMGKDCGNGNWARHFPGDLIMDCYELVGREGLWIKDEDVKVAKWAKLSGAKATITYLLFANDLI